MYISRLFSVYITWSVCVCVCVCVCVFTFTLWIPQAALVQNFPASMTKVQCVGVQGWGCPQQTRWPEWSSPRVLIRYCHSLCVLRVGKGWENVPWTLGEISHLLHTGKVGGGSASFSWILTENFPCLCYSSGYFLLKTIEYTSWKDSSGACCHPQ